MLAGCCDHSRGTRGHCFPAPCAELTLRRASPGRRPLAKWKPRRLDFELSCFRALSSSPTSCPTMRVHILATTFALATSLPSALATPPPIGNAADALAQFAPLLNGNILSTLQAALLANPVASAPLLGGLAPVKGLTDPFQSALAAAKLSGGQSNAAVLNDVQSVSIGLVLAAWSALILGHTVHQRRQGGRKRAPRVLLRRHRAHLSRIRAAGDSDPDVQAGNSASSYGTSFDTVLEQFAGIMPNSMMQSIQSSEPRRGPGALVQPLTHFPQRQHPSSSHLA